MKKTSGWKPANIELYSGLSIAHRGMKIGELHFMLQERKYIGNEVKRQTM